MTKRPAPDDDDTPAQPSRWREAQLARRTIRLGFLGLLDEAILRDIAAGLDPVNIGLVEDTVGALGSDAAFVRQWIDRWPAFDWNQRLVDAVRDAQLGLVRSLLLDKRVDPTASEHKALRVAVSRDREDIVALFLADARVDVAAARVFENTVGCWSSRTIGLMLRSGFVPRTTAIAVALETIPIDVAQLVLADARVDPAAYDNSLIREAARCGRTDIVQLLMDIPRVNPASQDNQPLFSAIRGGHDDTALQLLRDPRVDPAARNNYVIVKAASHGRFQVVHHLLRDKRVDPAIDRGKPLAKAASKGSTAIVRLLMAHPGVDPAADDNSALIGAIEAGSADAVACLCADPRVDPSVSNNYPIRAAASVRWNGGNAAVIRILLADRRVDPSAALCDAAASGFGEVVALLLADPRVGPIDPRLLCRTVRRPVLELLLADKRINPHGCRTYDAWVATADE